jgi:hypothetical protein
MLFSRNTWLASTTIVVAFLILLVSPNATRADDIVITNGFLQIGGAPESRGEWRNQVFDFAGNGFAARGGEGDGNRQGINSPCAFGPCQPGTTVFPNSNVILTGAGQATFDSTTVSAWWFGHDSRLSFSGPGVAIPNSTDPLITITAPFTMTGSLFVHTLEDSGHPVVFSTTISGSGIATLTLQMSQLLRPSGYIFSNLRYEFAPVPEPTTLSLLGAGLIALTARYRRRRCCN